MHFTDRMLIIKNDFIAIFFNMKNKKWFTLVELIMALIIAGTLIGIAMSIYTGLQWQDIRMSNKRLLVAESNDLIDKIHEAVLYYTIDYEEYFNRKWLWYNPWNTWFSTYGNEWERYYCWSWIDERTAKWNMMMFLLMKSKILRISVSASKSCNMRFK